MNYNYIKHLNTWFVLYKQSEEVRPLHASLYFSLFQLWNINRFPDGFYVTRGELMKVAKVASTSTYSKALKDMVAWGWIEYKAGNTFFGCSQFRLTHWQELEKYILADTDMMYPLLSTPAYESTTAPATASNGKPSTMPRVAPSSAPSIEPSSKRIYKTSKQVKQEKEVNNLNSNYNEPL